MSTTFNLDACIIDGRPQSSALVDFSETLASVGIHFSANGGALRGPQVHMSAEAARALGSALLHAAIMAGNEQADEDNRRVEQAADDETAEAGYDDYIRKALS